MIMRNTELWLYQKTIYLFNDSGEIKIKPWIRMGVRQERAARRRKVERFSWAKWKDDQDKLGLVIAFSALSLSFWFCDLGLESQPATSVHFAFGTHAWSPPFPVFGSLLSLPNSALAHSFGPEHLLLLFKRTLFPCSLGTQCPFPEWAALEDVAGVATDNEFGCIQTALAPLAVA